jgi:hypothetical protein
VSDARDEAGARLCEAGDGDPIAARAAALLRDAAGAQPPTADQLERAWRRRVWVRRAAGAKRMRWAAALASLAFGAAAAAAVAWRGARRSAPVQVAVSAPAAVHAPRTHQPPAALPAPPAVRAAPKRRSSVAAGRPEVRVDPPDPEIDALAEALRELRGHHAPARALAALDRYDARFPQGNLRHEARLARVEALLALDRAHEALAVVEALPSDASVPLGRDLTLLRGELRARAGRCREAIDDFGVVLARAAHDALTARALAARAACRRSIGDLDGERADRARLSASFPGTDGRAR